MIFWATATGCASSSTMSSAGILVPPSRDHFSSPPTVAALGIKDISRNRRAASPGHVSQRSAPSHYYTESTMHVVAVQAEDEQLVSRPGPPPPSPPASIEREILNETHQDASVVGVRLVSHEKLLPELPTSQLSEHESAHGKDPRPAFQPRKVFSLRSNQAHSPSTSKPVRERPTRRNTTGSSPNKPVATVQPGSSSSRGQLPSFGAALDDGIMDQDAHELANEIQQAAEQIRRERLSKRAKQQAQQAEHDAVEAALSRQDTRRSAGSAKDDVVLVGNLIGEGHVNYILMYNMLTGIRVGVRIYPLYSRLLS